MQQVGKTAIQQALVRELKTTKALAAKLTHVSTYTIWMSVNSYRGSGRKAWDKRTPEEKAAAIQSARKLLEAK